MSALAAARIVDKMGDLPVPELWTPGAKTNKIFYPGGIVMLELSSGFGVPGATGLGLVALGVNELTTTLDMTGVASGANTRPLRVRSGVYVMQNSAGADAITIANVGSDCHVVDDQTVALTDGGGTRSRAGRIVYVDSSGVWVLFNPWMVPAPRMVWPIPLDLPTLANAQSYNFTPGFAGRILKGSFTVRKPATTASKLATLTPGVAGVGVTGGAINLTSANCTPAGAEVAGASITGGNTFTPGQQLNLLVSAVTAFVEGDGTAFVVLERLGG